MKLSRTFLALASTVISISANADQICHIANAGFYMESAGNGVLVDTVIDQGLTGYVQPSKPLLEKIEKGQTPFDTVQLVLVTHYHADHFDPTSTLRHLRNNANAQYIMPPQTFEMVKKLGLTDQEAERIHTPLPDMDGNPQSYEFHGIKVEAYRISHGANRPIENLGYKVSFDNSFSFFHPGDMSTTTEQLSSVGLSKAPVDYLLLPFWTGLNEDSQSMVKASWNAKHIIPMHFQEENREWMQQYGGPVGVQKAARNAWGNSISLTGEMNCLPMEQ
ncbi:MBL fold metallo-hydrolase [Kordiimonas sp. SCSIO 12610]|uniref:MBL fold metallo-hydrolase n=1 Tax=Kordiimonas sp. SCSIO 12610 TaxID=2829597 RepID=UPI00210A1C89|nr:MBL fold metallo-hydrolase [Kordiimonas sp. SCSIO 12610]UTW54243.1 MBL fold metallo-hydrolase [Kordiimonas sp. SCSIO 12610]